MIGSSVMWVVVSVTEITSVFGSSNGLGTNLFASYFRLFLQKKLSRKLSLLIDYAGVKWLPCVRGSGIPLCRQVRLGKTLPTNLEGRNHFSSFGELVKTKKGARVSHLIWLATTWNLWKLRNNVLFNGALPDASSLVDDIKDFSWVWFKGRCGRNCCILFSSWCIDHLACFQSL
jgi:hypothetical protein